VNKRRTEEKEHLLTHTSGKGAKLADGVNLRNGVFVGVGKVPTCLNERGKCQPGGLCRLPEQCFGRLYI
jgi:hypothetical protein